MVLLRAVLGVVLKKKMKGRIKIIKKYISEIKWYVTSGSAEHNESPCLLERNSFGQMTPDIG